VVGAVVAVVVIVVLDAVTTVLVQTVLTVTVVGVSAPDIAVSCFSGSQLYPLLYCTILLLKVLTLS
jgi:hypothetical protein